MSAERALFEPGELASLGRRPGAFGVETIAELSLARWRVLRDLARRIAARDRLVQGAAIERHDRRIFAAQREREAIEARLLRAPT